mgnify:CR=1 FL=1
MRDAFHRELESLDQIVSTTIDRQVGRSSVQSSSPATNSPNGVVTSNAVGMTIDMKSITPTERRAIRPRLT